MVLAFYKVAALVLKVFSKPFIEYTKKTHLSNNAAIQNPKTRQRFIQLGNTFNYYEQVINRKFLEIDSQFAYKPLNEELAIEKGINFFYELLFYIIIISIPIYEMSRSQKQSKLKSKQLQKKIKTIQSRYEHLLIQIKQEKKKIQQKRIVAHSFVKADARKVDPLCKLNFKFPDKKTHVYYIDFII